MRERDLNYQHLRYFRTVAHEGSVQRAARQLHLAPSTISGQIKACLLYTSDAADE